MTDALLPAAPQPLEKEGDDYFRKVSGESADPLCPRKLQSVLKGLAAGVGLDRRGRGRGRRREGTAGLVRAERRRRGVGRRLHGAWSPEQMAAWLGRAGAQAGHAQVGT